MTRLALEPADGSALARGRGWGLRRLKGQTVGLLGLVVLLAVAVPCFVTLPWSLQRYDVPMLGEAGADPQRPPSLGEPFGADRLGRSLLWRCLLGGAIS